MRPDDARKGFAALLRTALGADVDVIETPRADPPKIRPRVTIAVGTVTNADRACPDVLVGLEAWCAVPQLDDTGPADDALDALLADVLEVVDAMPRTSWTTADRGVFLDGYPAYRVKIERR